ncbi:MAG: S-layer homology domain-containing protein [Clostridiales bacterium]|nr:S-layer homology domain-containing protein [Clostridiales bacterium]
MKKILGAVLCIMLLTSVFALKAFCAARESVDDGEKARVMQLLEIMNGDENGDLNLENDVTRAEFVKMAVCASSEKNNTPKNMSVSVFPDVTASHWAAGYVSVAIKSGIVNGYLDGTFKPENNVKLEEAVNIILKLLGYTTDDFKGNYPDSQLEKYESIGLDKDINAKKGETLTRLECMKLIYNMLCTETKQGGVYGRNLGVNVDSDGKVDYLSLLNANMTGPYVNMQSNFTEKIEFPLDENSSIYRDGKLSDEKSVKDYDVYYYCRNIKTVWFYSDKAFGKIDSVLPSKDVPESLKVGNASYALLPGAAKKVSFVGDIDKDDYVMILLDKDGKAADVYKADYEMYLEYSDEKEDMLSAVNETLSDSIVFTTLADLKEKVPFDINGAEIICNSSNIGVNQIEENDVVYYSTAFNTLWVYREKASGVCTAVNPNKESPSSVVVGGNNYNLSTDAVKYKFSNYGTLNSEMLVTLILGKDGSVVDAYEAGLDIIGDEYNDVSYALVVSSTLKGPYIVGEDGKLPADTGIDVNTAKIYKGNGNASKAEIKKYSVYYYSKLLNAVWLYDETVSGTIEDITPKSQPTSVKIAGKNYSLSTSKAQFDFSSLGTYKVGNRVTALLDKDGNIAGTTEIGSIDADTVGIVLENGKSEYYDADGRKYSTDSIKIYALNGETYTFEGYSSAKVGDIVRVSAGKEKNVINNENPPKNASAAKDVINAVKEGKFASDAKIIENYRGELYGKVEISEISGKTLDYSVILFYELASDGSVKSLILDNYTGNLFEYGYLFDNETTDSISGKTSHSYTYMLDDNMEYTYTPKGTIFVSSGAAKFTVKNGSVSKVESMKSSIEIHNISGDTAYTEKGEKYQIADNVRVYSVSGAKVKAIDFKDVLNGEYAHMTGYYDKSAEKGGKIRVIIVF